jgi:hypothetical protein
MPGVGGALSVARPDVVDRDRQCVTRLSTVDVNGAGDGVAPRHFGFVTLVAGAADLARERIFGFDQQLFAGVDDRSRLLMTAEFVDQGLGGDALHDGLVQSELENRRTTFAVICETCLSTRSELFQLMLDVEKTEPPLPVW